MAAERTGGGLWSRIGTSSISSCGKIAQTSSPLQDMIRINANPF
ncbi:protein of unknown function [Methylocella tundrae]|uniref:Uncharacterized protein n=1 Tax=Methylocella tundrae TaxID=227605 RepID=A0A4U8Z5K2_METTU|nr:protein of unknown function [Methylocella tundrae]